jgi:hypothetical protein
LPKPLQFLKLRGTHRSLSTLTYLVRNANIPSVHANLQGTIVNQSTITTPKASRTATIIRRTPWPRSPLGRALHAIADNLGVAFQIDRTSIPSTRSPEPRFRSSTSANGTHDPTARHRPMALITATSNPISVELRKCPGAMPSPTVSFPTTVIRIWRRDR